MKMKIENIFFDLDGTLTDPKEGIVNCIQFACVGLGHKLDAADDLTWCIGPPIQESFRKILGTDDETIVVEAIRLYRDRFADVGIFENGVYDGIIDVLEGQIDAGRRLFVATSKAEIYARRIIEHYGLSGWFEGIYGSEMDGRFSDKKELLKKLLSDQKLTPGTSVMIGDRVHDIDAARVNGARAIGVTYGYGTDAELAAAAPDGYAATPAEITAAIDALGM